MFNFHAFNAGAKSFENNEHANNPYHRVGGVQILA